MAKERSLLARHSQAVLAQYQALAGGVILTLLFVALKVLGIEVPPWLMYAGVVLGVVFAQYRAWRAQVLKGIEDYEPDVGEGLRLDRETPLMDRNGSLHHLDAELTITTPPSELLAIRIVCSAPIVKGYCTALVQPYSEAAELDVPRQNIGRFEFRENLLPVGAKLHLGVSSPQPIHLMEISRVPLKA